MRAKHERKDIYNSRNYYRLLNDTEKNNQNNIYNSRNYYRLLNADSGLYDVLISTTVEITIGYLTMIANDDNIKSTTVEITIGYLTLFRR